MSKFSIWKQHYSWECVRHRSRGFQWRWLYRDLAVPSRDVGLVNVFLNKGDGTFQPPELVSGENSYNPVGADP